MRHIEVRGLWIQQLVRQGRLSLQKMQGSKNPADVLTKYLDKTAAKALLSLAGIWCGTTDEAVGAEGGG